MTSKFRLEWSPHKNAIAWTFFMHPLSSAIIDLILAKEIFEGLTREISMLVDSSMLDLSTFKPSRVNTNSTEEQKIAVLRS